MKNLSIMLKPASSLCNLRCRYCFYADVSQNRSVQSYGVMNEETLDRVIENIYASLDSGDSLHFAFQGGEPTVAGLGWHRSFISKIARQPKRVKVTYALQTNATLLDDSWCRFLKENGFLVGVSLDGMESVHNLFRVDAEGAGTFKTVMNSVKLLNQYKVDYNILMTLTNSLARHPVQVWNFIVENNFRYVQFTPCLSEFHSSGRTPYELTPERFSSFYKQLFVLWKKEFDRGNYYSIKLFDDLVNLLAFGQINACGLTGVCSPQIVVESDGSVYPCDFYMLDEWKTGDLTRQPLEEIFSSPAGADFCRRERVRPLCSECRYKKICNGGCARMQSQVCYSEDGTFCGYRDFLDSALNDLLAVARSQRLMSQR